MPNRNNAAGATTTARARSAPAASSIASRVSVDRRAAQLASLGDVVPQPEINALGIALHGPRGKVYAVSAGGPARKLTRQWLGAQVAPRLVQARRAIERELGMT